MNSSFFNQGQWVKAIELLDSMIPSEKNFRFITYDGAGIGESSYYSKAYTINDFVEEFDSIIKLCNLNKVHIFGISIGAWVGLNLYFLRPNLVKSFFGYGNLAPYHETYQRAITEFEKLSKFFKIFNKLKNTEINLTNWEQIFENFYVSFFLSDFHDENYDKTKLNNAKKILAKVLFPIVKGNKINYFYDYYNYITKTIINEGKNLLDLINNSKNKNPIMFANGKSDHIAHYSMTVDLNKRIPDSQMLLFDNLGHGNLLLGKGNKYILKEYVNFLNK